MRRVVAFLVAVLLVISLSASAEGLPSRLKEYVNAVNYYVPFKEYTAVDAEQSDNGGRLITIEGSGYKCDYYESDIGLYFVLSLDGIEPTIPFIAALQMFADFSGDDAALYYYSMFASATPRNEIDLFTMYIKGERSGEAASINITVKK